MVFLEWNGGVRKANQSTTSTAYINNLKRKYGKAIYYDKRTKKYEINKYTDDYKKARKSTIKKAAIGAGIAAVAGTAAYLHRKSNIKKSDINLLKNGKQYGTYNTITRELKIDSNPLKAKLTRREGKAITDALLSDYIKEYKRLIK